MGVDENEIVDAVRWSRWPGASQWCIALVMTLLSSQCSGEASPAATRARPHSDWRTSLMRLWVRISGCRWAESAALEATASTWPGWRGFRSMSELG